MIFITDCVTCCCQFETYCSRNITGVNLVDFFSVVCVHLQDTAYTFFFTLCRVVNVRTCIQCTGVHTEECQLTNEGVIHDLECQSGERFFVGRMSFYFLVCFGIDTFDSGDIDGSGHIFDNAVQQFLNAFVSVSGTAEYGNQFAVDTCFTQCFFQFFFCDFFFSEEFFHQFFVCFADCFDHFCSVFFSFVQVFCGDVFFVDFFTQIIFIDQSFHFHQVDDTNEIAFCTDRQSNSNRCATQSVYHHLQYIIEVCTHDVHFVNKCHSGYVVVVSLTPYSFGLRFYTAFCAEYANGTVQYTQGTFNFYCEVNVTWCVNDVDSVTIPLTSCRCGSNCDTSFLFLFHPVHGCSTFMSITDFIVYTSIIEDTLCQCCFTSIDMGHNTNISGSLQWVFSFSQGKFLLLESVMSESFVCFCHFVHIFFTFYRCACIVCSIHNFVCQSFFHGLFSSFSGEHC